MKDRIDVVARVAEISRRIMRIQVAREGWGTVARHDQAQSALLEHVAGYGLDPRDRAVVVGLLIAMSFRSRYSLGIAVGLLAEAIEDQVDVSWGGER